MPRSDLIIVPVWHHWTNWSPRSLCGSLLPMKAPLLWTSTHSPATHLVSLSWLEVEIYIPGAQNTITCLNSNLLKLELPWLWRHLQMQCPHQQFLPRKLGLGLTIRDECTYNDLSVHLQHYFFWSHELDKQVSYPKASFSLKKKNKKPLGTKIPLSRINSCFFKIFSLTHTIDYIEGLKLWLSCFMTKKHNLKDTDLFQNSFKFTFYILKTSSWPAKESYLNVCWSLPTSTIMLLLDA